MLLLLRAAGHLWILSLIFLKLCSAQDIQCTVTQDGRRTLYSVSEFKAINCYYQWINTTKHVLANQEKHTDDQVVMKSNRTLLLYKCSEQIYYSRNCLSEGMKREATCTTNCSGNARLGGETQTELRRNHWIVPTAAATVVLLLLLLLLCYKFRDHVCSCRKLRCLYTSVKTQNNMADMEGQHG